VKIADYLRALDRRGRIIKIWLSIEFWLSKPDPHSHKIPALEAIRAGTPESLGTLGTLGPFLDLGPFWTLGWTLDGPLDTHLFGTLGTLNLEPF
jgi:hypothetical protein